MTPKNMNFKTILDPKMDPKMVYLGYHPPWLNPAGAILQALVSKMAPRWLKMAPGSPR